MPKITAKKIEPVKDPALTPKSVPVLMLKLSSVPLVLKSGNKRDSLKEAEIQEGAQCPPIGADTASGEQPYAMLGGEKQTVRQQTSTLAILTPLTPDSSSPGLLSLYQCISCYS